MVDVTRRNLLKIGGAAGLVASVPFKAAAAEFTNPRYFGVQFLKEAGSNLHQGRNVTEIISSIQNGDTFNLYDPQNIAEALRKTWNEGSGLSKDRVIEAFIAGDLVPLEIFIGSGDRDQSMSPTIDDQFNRILVGAIRDVDQGHGTSGRSDYKQIADPGLQAAVSVLSLVKASGDEAKYQELKSQIDEITAFMSERWKSGVAIFADDIAQSLSNNPRADVKPRLNP